MPSYFKTDEARARHNERVRKRNLIRYRLSKGIPLDAPLSNRGAKRGFKKKVEPKLPPLKFYWQ